MDLRTQIDLLVEKKKEEKVNLGIKVAQEVNKIDQELEVLERLRKQAASQRAVVDAPPRTKKKAIKTKAKVLQQAPIVTSCVLEILKKNKKGLKSTALLKAVNIQFKKKFTKKQISNCLNSLRMRKVVKSDGGFGKPGNWKLI